MLIPRAEGKVAECARGAAMGLRRMLVGRFFFFARGGVSCGNEKMRELALKLVFYTVVGGWIYVLFRIFDAMFFLLSA